MSFINVLKIIKTMYAALCYISSVFCFCFNIVWLCCTLIPWLVLFISVIYLLSKLMKLKAPHEKSQFVLFEDDSYAESSGKLYWPVANKGAAFDAPENSAAALKNVIGTFALSI